MADALPSNRDGRVAPGDDAPTIDDQDLVNLLASYCTEAEEARQSGPNPRDDVWRSNWDRYWGRYDMADKAPWQSRHVMPEVPQFVDRWAAAMREALASVADALARQDADDFSGESETLFVMMQQHNMKEEGVLYPMCDQRLAAEADALGERIEHMIEEVRA